MTSLSQSDDSIVIQKYLQGKSTNQIADETEISKGKVHYLINDWKQKIEISDIDEIRDFTVLVRKSNMSIQQCAQGFRMINILKNLGIQEEGDDTIDIDDDNIRNPKYNELYTFIEDIYLTCKSLCITLYIISSWIKDLFDFHVKNSSIINNSSSLIEKYKGFNKKPLISDSFQAENKVNHETETNIDNNSNSDLKLKDESPVENDIPFISLISYYISKEKRI